MVVDIDTHALIATEKALLKYSFEGTWKFESIYFDGMPVQVVYRSPYTTHWWVAVAHSHWGVKLHRSTNEGKTWQAITLPKLPNTTLLNIWCIKDTPEGYVYLGIEPAGLLYAHHDDLKDDLKFELIESLWNHPSKTQWQIGGKGSKAPFLHSISFVPNSGNCFFVGISCAGIFCTKDRGLNWLAHNKGLRADYLPNPYAKIGHDPHAISICEEDPSVMWQQNHCGIFRSEDGGLSWYDVSYQDIRYGFNVLASKENPLEAWTVPVSSEDKRIPLGKKLSIAHTKDGGKTWQQTSISKEDFSYGISLRKSLGMKDKQMLLGTNNGGLYASGDRGKTWRSIHQNLAKIRGVVLY